MATRTPLAERVYRWLLRCYPGEFRDEYEQEMLMTFRDRARQDRRGVAVLRLWAQVIGDSLFKAPGEHLDVLRQDARYAFRSLRRAPLFAFTTIATLALAVGANTAIFSVVHAVALRPLPYDRSQRLVRIWEANTSLAIPEFAVSLPNFLSWRERARTLDLGAWIGGSVTLQGAGDPVRVPSAAVSGSFFDLLGVTPMAGRTLKAADEKLDAPPVAVITEGIWRSQFGGATDVVGRTVTISGMTHAIVGIIPENVVPSSADFFTPLRIDLAKEGRDNRIAQVLGSLKPGVTFDQARAEMEEVARQLSAEYPGANKGWGVSLSTMYEWIVPQNLRLALYIVLASVGCVLLIACANVAGLMLARAAGRKREVAVRLAIGAARRRLIRQVMTEGFLLTMVGGSLGVILAYWAVPALRVVLPDSLPRGDEATVNAPVLLFSLAMCVVTGIIFSTLPAVAGSRAQLVDSLKESARGTTATSTTWRQILASAQIALATVLLIAAGLLSASLYALQRVELGFEPANLTTAMMGLPTDRYNNIDKAWGLYARLLERLSTSPGLEAAALTSGAPFGGGDTGMPIEAVGPSRLKPGEKLQAAWRMVSPGYFSTLRVPLVRGQFFTGNTTSDAMSMIVSSSMARAIWGSDDVIGRQIAAGPPGTFTIVGVVGDIRNLDLARAPDPTMYISSAQFTWPTMTIVVRTQEQGLQPASLIRSAVRDLDPQLAVFNLQQITAQVGRSAAQPRLNAGLVAMFAIVAALLSALGIYGVLAFLVSQSRQEIGIRLALGAAKRTVLVLFLRRAAWLGSVGLAAGLVAAFVAARALQSQVFGISARDPLTYAAAVVLVVVIVLTAAIVPASRAASTDPLTAIRE